MIYNYWHLHIPLAWPQWRIKASHVVLHLFALASFFRITPTAKVKVSYSLLPFIEIPPLRLTHLQTSISMPPFPTAFWPTACAPLPHSLRMTDSNICSPMNASSRVQSNLLSPGRFLISVTWGISLSAINNPVRRVARNIYCAYLARSAGHQRSLQWPFQRFRRKRLRVAYDTHASLGRTPPKNIGRCRWAPKQIRLAHLDPHLLVGLNKMLPNNSLRLT